jgi:hypothetical protein
MDDINDATYQIADRLADGRSSNGPRVDSRLSACSDSDRPMTPVLSHRLRHNKSILALAFSADSIFAGTEGGEILVSYLFCGILMSVG